MSDTTIVIGHSSQRKPFRTPVCRVLVNGVEPTGYYPTSVTIQRTRYARCDTVDLSFSIDRGAISTNGYWFDLADPASGQTLADIPIIVEMRDQETAGSQWTRMFTGFVDHVSFDPGASTLQITGRDYLAKLMDLRVMDAWLNKTGSELVTAAITAAGLTPDVTLPGGYEGQYWQIEHKRQSSAAQHRFQTAFDLARYVANGSNCDLYANGQTIVCAPYPSPTDSSSVVHPLPYYDPGNGAPIQINVRSLMMERDYQIAKGVEVHCISWDGKQRIKAEVYFSATGGSKTKSLDNGMLHSFRFPGLKQDMLLAKAQMLYKQIVAHERTVSLSIPGLLSLSPRQFFRISGTGTTWDGTIDVDAVTTSFTPGGSFTQSVTLRNRSTADNEDGEYD
ncbi:hypothetical protein AD929_15615 [Gluconobacter potus]|uniref:Phage protein D n=1 Tax=Gluconobacter potus TaxID=2724927 RepID=A0A149QPJ8_9PROT|nr:hypothetical protein [Gluconobacter potus]KXU99225.1 hypothetical protein AD929_15615 [Gluconobacter potus]